ncbi:hypothetical protein RRG08_049971 [Elysia crispata]|uniref:Uncharacterized protein n=1 Tax=Elysia crispata TaxID=231223 RepID=A0AAE1EC47_9GAST|nr:hypothetical protein RRG08_049971 [Elysia crispata]
MALYSIPSIFTRVGILSMLCTVVWTQTQKPKGKSVNVSSYLADPFLIQVMPDDSPNGPEYEGYIPDLLDELSILTDTEYTIVVNTDNHPGKRRANKTWGGVVGDVTSGRAQMGAGPITETGERRKDVDFSTPFMSFGPVVILQRPRKQVMGLQERLRRLFLPLSESVWYMSGLAWLVTSAVLYIISYVNPYDWRKLMKDKQATLREGESFTCLNTFWFTMSTLMWQGYTRGPRSLGARIVVTLWWLYVLTFIIMYIASMTNYLRLGPTPKQTQRYTYIQKVEDLARQTQLNYGVLENGSTQQMLKKMKWKSTVSSIESGVEKVRKSNSQDDEKPFALVAESAMAKYYTMKEPCDLYMVGDLTTIGTYAMVLPAGSPDLMDVDLGLLYLRESGKLRELENKWFSGVCTDFIMDSSSGSRIQLPPFYEVDLGTFSGALIMLGMGLVLGAIVTGLEIVVFKYAESGNKPKERRALNSSNPDQTKASGYTSAATMEPITDV